VTAPRFRRHRSSDGRRPVLAGDFPDDGRDITEILHDTPTADWDGTAPLTALRGQPRYTPAVSPADDYRQAIAQANTEAGLYPRPPAITPPRGPDMFPALQQDPPGTPLPPIPPHTYDPDSHQYGRPCTLCGEGPDHPLHNQRDTGPQQRLPRFSRTAARPRPQRPPDCAIFVWVPSISQHVLLCGMCRWRRHADPITASMPFTFESLRQSAYITGWRLDAFTRWCCPACQDTAAYWSPRQVTHSHPDLRALHAAGKPIDETSALVVADGVRGHVVPAADGTRRDAEAWFCGVAELDLIGDVAAGRKHGRHAAVTR